MEVLLQPTKITQLLCSAREGDSAAIEAILTATYAELRQIARGLLHSERQNHTLQPTALVHEAYLRLVGPSESNDIQNKKHFFALAAQIMRRILVDSARARLAEKRGSGDVIQLDFESPQQNQPMITFNLDQLLDLEDALQELIKINVRYCKIIELRYFMGLSNEDIAEILNISEATLKRDWSAAKAWLYQRLGGLTPL